MREKKEVKGVKKEEEMERMNKGRREGDFEIAKTMKIEDEDVGKILRFKGLAEK